MRRNTTTSTTAISDINIVPSRRTRSSKDVSTAWQLDAYRFEIPVIAHPTDALVLVVVFRRKRYLARTGAR